ncbi:collagen-like protein [Wenzhouxiangella marina]|uniref:Uncharacterized protein n=1 Tax=Wenzhouxiangella marina TaxID=1579979 RepID=A0A0K0XTV3_9GAMM|nr:collagen-like protein [Wenzhouxiangella marina]AKS41090.1 hypothetical protein WM2015_709 [Wenzhouxiangella marina]MBB6087969.1 hypothetical protein [Wenzhouxiangella marina]
MNKLRGLAPLTLAISTALMSASVLAQSSDVVIQAPPGGTVRVEDSAGNSVFLQVNDDGTLVLPGIAGDPEQTSVLCFEAATGILGPCTAAAAIGPTGPTGPAGPPGPTGAQGDPGPVGAVGATGPAGATGPQGNAGPPGPTGPTGAMGATGPAGAQGPIGATGPTGAIGATGPAGADGATGPAGPTGPIGPQGNQGPPGPIGATGPAGAPGPIGPIGPTGPAGAIGATGPAGAPGPTGPVGPIGPTGPSGQNFSVSIQGTPINDPTLDFDYLGYNGRGHSFLTSQGYTFEIRANQLAQGILLWSGAGCTGTPSVLVSPSSTSSIGIGQIFEAGGVIYSSSPTALPSTVTPASVFVPATGACNPNTNPNLTVPIAVNNAATTGFNLPAAPLQVLLNPN